MWARGRETLGQLALCCGVPQRRRPACRSAARKGWGVHLTLSSPSVPAGLPIVKERESHGGVCDADLPSTGPRGGRWRRNLESKQAHPDVHFFTWPPGRRCQNLYLSGFLPKTLRITQTSIWSKMTVIPSPQVGPWSQWTPGLHEALAGISHSPHFQARFTAEAWRCRHWGLTIRAW